MKSLLLLSAFLLEAVALSFQAQSRLIQFTEFRTKFGRNYSDSDEESSRFSFFVQNMDEADQIALLNPHATFGYNHLSDWSPAELARIRGYKAPLTNIAIKELPVPDIEAAAVIDWRTSGKVSPVKDQGVCGCCWAFAAAQEIESMWAMKGHSVPELSPQQLASCSAHGCISGSPQVALDYVQSIGGIESESNYPYTNGRSQQTAVCEFKSSLVFPGIKVTGHSYAGRNDETTMATQVSSIGPIAVTVDAKAWASYKGGVLTQCGTQVDHAVQIVGYDRTASPPFWIVRNSWGTTWGENGYMRLAMGNNVCGISSYPIAVQLA